MMNDMKKGIQEEGSEGKCRFSVGHVAFETVDGVGITNTVLTSEIMRIDGTNPGGGVGEDKAWGQGTAFWGLIVERNSLVRRKPK